MDLKNSVLCYLKETVGIHADKIAVNDGKGTVTFEELNNTALSLSYKISSVLGGKKRSPIMVYLPKSCASIIAFMGVLYSGNFYTPTDVAFPYAKVKSITDILEPALYVSDTKNSNKLIENGISKNMIVNIDELDMENKLDCSDSIIDTDIVYTLFTSGSTGVPKGVAVSNRSIIDYIEWAIDTFDISSTEIIGNQAPFYFDNSTLDIYLSVFAGASLYIIPKMNFSFPVKLIEYVNKNNINMIFWVPSVFISVANADILSRVPCECLKKILFAGEVMPNKQLNYWRKYIPDAVYANLYGPTEITVDCTYYIVNREFADDDPLPIGIPCRNSDVMILDENDQLITSPDKTGELCVRGTSLAMGYWNNPSKTKEAFVQNPLNAHYPETIYRTGDIVYYNSLGEIMFSGRKDFQIKHLGHRIELGEIENAACGIEAVKNVCAVYNTEKRQIVLFYQGNTGEKDILDHLTKTLPAYMIPSVIKNIPAFPYNDNGKIDRKKLMNEFI